MIPRLYLYGAIGLLFAGISLTAYIQTKRVGALKSELSTAEATIAAERENTRKADEAAKRHQARSDALEADRRNNPLPPVRVCKPASVPKARAASVPDEATKTHDPPADEGDRDIGPALDEFATDAEANLNQCEELMRWVNER
jgi:hypothetical protein